MSDGAGVAGVPAPISIFRQPIARSRFRNFDIKVQYDDVRGTFHLGVIACLVLALAQAPFLHFHDSDPGHEHAHGFAHTHWAAEHFGGLALFADDQVGDAQSLTWFPGDGYSSIRLASALPARVALPEPTVVPSSFPELTAHNHDPPWRLALKSRAPPA